MDPLRGKTFLPPGFKIGRSTGLYTLSKLEEGETYKRVGPTHPNQRAVRLWLLHEILEGRMDAKW